ncbi:uncharacterized protein [Phyllobates terribilis]|uniref:uncharacterized protein isoform X2 n=1 Tax=Phyllobates terribilis TaxID=111132 RepID=UPI003CCAAD51
MQRLDVSQILGNSEMKHFLVSLLCAVVLLSLGNVAAVTNVYGSLGTSILFIVNVPLGSSVQWSYNGTPVYNSSSPPQCLNQFIGRCESYQNGSLRINSVSYADDGAYVVSVLAPGSPTSYTNFQLKVYVPVSNVAVTSNVSGLVWPGLDSVSLRCSALGTNVSYSWSLQGAPISGGGRYTLTDNNSTLILNPVSTNDNGSFICTAKNIINSLNSSDVKLNLASPVSAVTLTSNTSAVLWAGEDSVSLHCSAQGSAITFSWSLNGNQVSSKPPYYITQSDSPPSSNLTISPVSKIDTGPFTCMASNRANSITSRAANLNINWSPDGNIVCAAQPINQTIQLGCSWPEGIPAANVTMIFNNLQDTSSNEVHGNVNHSSDIYGSSLTCNGNQLGRTSSCVLVFETPTSPNYKNYTVTPALVGGAVNLTVNLQAGVQSRATASSIQVLPATFSWFRGNSSSSIQTGSKFKVDSTPYISILNIDKLSAAESGEYKCVAENFIGNTTFLFNVKVSQSGGSSSGLDGGAIAGIIIGVLAGVAIIGVIAFFIFKKRIHRRKSPESVYENPDSRSENMYERNLPGTASNRTPPRKEEPDYQTIIHGNNSSFYCNMMPGSRK